MGRALPNAYSHVRYMKTLMYEAKKWFVLLKLSKSS